MVGYWVILAILSFLFIVAALVVKSSFKDLRIHRSWEKDVMEKRAKGDMNFNYWSPVSISEVKEGFFFGILGIVLFGFLITAGLCNYSEISIQGKVTDANPTCKIIKKLDNGNYILFDDETNKSFEYDPNTVKE